MRAKPSRKCLLINQMIWPTGLATDKLYIVVTSEIDNRSILRYHKRKSQTTGIFTRTLQLLTFSNKI